MAGSRYSKDAEPSTTYRTGDATRNIMMAKCYFFRYQDCVNSAQGPWEALMKWTLKIVTPEGEIFYSEPMDIHGNRRLCRKAQFAEQFDSLPAAEIGLSYFQLLWEYRNCCADILEVAAE